MNNTTGTLIILLSIGGLFFLAKPMWEDIGMLQSEKDTYVEAIDQVTQIEIQTGQLLAQIDNINDLDKEKMEVLLPDKQNFARLATEISSIGSPYGISVSDMSVNMDNGGGSAAEAHEGSSASYESATINFEFEAGYLSAKSFIEDLEKSLRLLDIQSISLTSTEVSQSYNVEAKIYWLNTNNSN